MSRQRPLARARPEDPETQPPLPPVRREAHARNRKGFSPFFCFNAFSYTFVPSGNSKPKKYLPPRISPIFSSSSTVKVQRFSFWLKLEGVVPIRKQFMSTAEYYSTVFHELTHSTGHSSRLNRLTQAAFFGSEDYSKEELVAEIGAAALVNHVGLETSNSIRNSAAYIQNWLKVLRDDKRFIVSASGRAEKAVSLILGSVG